MKQKLAVIIIHGLGMQPQNYAESFVHLLRKAYTEVSDISSSESHLDIEPVFWADLIEEKEKELYNSLVIPYDLHYKQLRRFIIHYLADAVAYQPMDTGNQNYDAVHKTISLALNKLSNKIGHNAPLCVISHSLGTVIASNFFYDLQNPSNRKPAVINPGSALERGDTLTNFYSLGTTLPLWSMRYRNFDKPIQVPSFRAETYYPGLEGEWVNFYDKDDILAYPLRSVDRAYESAVKEDIEINAGDWMSSWNPICHSGYLTSDKLTRRIAESLARTWLYVNGDDL